MAARTREASSTVKPRPDLLRRLLRAKDRMDAPPDQDWPIPRLAELSAVSPAHFARGFKPLTEIAPDVGGQETVASHRHGAIYWPPLTSSVAPVTIFA